MTTHKSLVLKVTWIVGAVFVLPLESVQGQPTNLVNTELLQENDDGSVCVEGPLIIEDLTINGGQEWTFTSSQNIRLEKSVRFNSGSKVRLAISQCGYVGGSCCSGSYPCGLGLECKDSKCVHKPLGFVSRENTRACNRCVEGSVMEILDAISLNYRPMSNIEYDVEWFGVYPPDTTVFPEMGWEVDVMEIDHVQGIGRIPGIMGENWIVGTRSEIDDFSGVAGIFFAQLGDVNGNGGEPFFKDSSSSNNRLRLVFPIEGVDHPGGLQVIGQTLVFATHAGESSIGPSVYFYDLSNLDRYVEGTPAYDEDLTSLDARMSVINLRSDFNWNEIGVEGPPDGTSAVAIVRMSSGSYLMAVQGGSTSHHREMWFFRSLTNRELSPATEWIFDSYHEYDLTRGAENINFITECSGAIFLAHTTNETEPILDPLTNFMAVSRLKTDASGKFIVDRWPPLEDYLVIGLDAVDNDICNFRAAGNVYVTPTGRLVIYCSEKHNLETDPSAEIGLAEFVDWSY